MSKSLKLVGISLFAALGVIVLGSLLLWKYSSLTRERVYVLALHSGYPDLEASAARTLREYPGEEAAINLVLFINEKSPQVRSNLELRKIEERLFQISSSIEARQVEDWGKLQLEITRLTARQRALQNNLSRGQEVENALANSALWSLAVISGEGFGTGYEHDNPNAPWPSVQVNEWPDTRDSMNHWALDTFLDKRLSGLKVKSKGEGDGRKRPF